MPSTTETLTKAGGSTYTEVFGYRTGGNGATITTATRTINGAGEADPGSTTPGATPSTTSTSASPSSSAPVSSAVSPSSTSSGAANANAGSNSAQATSSSGLTGGAVAGVAIGCAIGGALIAFLIAFLIFRKKNQRNQRQYSAGGGYPPSDASSNQRDVIPLAEKMPPKSGAGGGTVMGWQAYLPQSADDRTIQNGVKTFFNLIELHVDNFYRKAPVELDQRTREALSQIDSGKLPGRIDHLMQDQRLVLPVIKHCIADLLITRMSPLTYPETSLLPVNLSAVPTKLQSTSLATNERTAVQQAYSQWRLLNAYLYPNPESDSIYIDDREAKASEIASLLSLAFAPWSSSTQKEDQNEMHQHEKGLVATAGNLGILLMSQPSAFEFKWSGDSGRSGSGAGAGAGRSLVALPGFWKTTDETGRPLGSQQLLVSPLMLRV